MCCVVLSCGRSCVLEHAAIGTHALVGNLICLRKILGPSRAIIPLFYNGTKSGARAVSATSSLELNHLLHARMLRNVIITRGSIFRRPGFEASATSIKTVRRADAANVLGG